VGALADVVLVESVHPAPPNTTVSGLAACPEANPVVLGGGYRWGNGGEPGFALWSNFPAENGWAVSGQSTLPQSRNLVVQAICASDGSSG
jgi:hypothetical protein